MPIRYSASVDTSPVEGLEVFWNQFDDVAYEQWQDVVTEYEPDILSELQTEPPPAVHPIEWTSDKQRKFVMAKLRRENNLPYQRKGTLADAWVVTTVRDDRGFVMVIENPSAISKFVYGSLAINRTAALRFQQKFHVNTGWQAATDTVQFWITALVEEYRNRMLRIAFVNFKGRAYTR